MIIESPDDSETKQSQPNLERGSHVINSRRIWINKTRKYHQNILTRLSPFQSNFFSLTDLNFNSQSVYDHDTFSAHDIMGEAEIDIQPLITSAMALGDIDSSENMQIGKWLKSNDNALIHDSIINVVDGKVQQEILLKLQNVECGELVLELEWIPLDA